MSLPSLLDILFLLSLIIPGIGIAKKLHNTFNELEPIEIVICSIIVSVIHVGLFSFLTATLGFFSLVNVWLLLVLATFIYNWREVEFLKFFKFLVHKPMQLFLFVLLSGVAILSFPHPAEWLSNYHMDAGRYTNAASMILKHGRYTIPNELPPYSDMLDKEELDKVPGMFNVKRENHYGVPYVHLYPSFQAFALGHVGLYGSLKLNWIFSIFVAAVFYLLIKLISSSSILSFFGALLVFTNPACQLYFIRNMTETVSSLLLISSFTFLYFLHHKPSKLVATLSALCVSMLALCRLEFGILYATFPAVFFLIFLFTDTKPSKYFTWFLGVHLFLLFGVATYYHYLAEVYVFLNTRANLGDVFSYFGLNYKALRPWGVQIWFAFTGGCLLVNLLITKYFPQVFNIDFLDSRTFSKIFSYIVMLLFVAFLGWNYFLRSDFNPELFIRGSDGYSHDTVNFIRLTYFLDPICIILGLFGAYKMLQRHDIRIFALLIIVVSVLTIIKSGHTPPLFWWIRRYVPVVITGWYIFYIYSLLSFKPFFRSMFIVFSLAFNLMVTTNVTRGFTDNHTISLLYENLSSIFDEDSVQLCFEGDRCNRAAVPLHLHYHVPSIYLTPGLSSNKIALIQALLKDGKRVFITTSSYALEAFEEEDLLKLKELGLDIELKTAPTFYFSDLVSLSTTWQPGEDKWKFYIPPTLFGDKVFHARNFPVRIFEVE
jgi:hypothetical protein